MNKSKKFILHLFLIIFIFSLVNMNLSQEINKEKTIQEEVKTKKPQQNKKDSTPQKEDKSVKTEITATQKSQQKYFNDLYKMLSDSQRNIDRAIGILSLVATFTCGLVALFAIGIMIASLTGLLSYRRWSEIRKNIEEDAKYIKEIRQRLDEEFNNIRKEVDKIRLPFLPEETTKEFKEKLNEFSRKLEFFEFLGLSLKSQDYINRGWDLIYKDNLEFAIKAFDKALGLDPDNSQAWFGKGYVLAEDERNKESLEAYEKAIELKPDYAASWNNKGIVLKRLERFEEALKTYEKAIELKPDDAGLWNNKCIVLGILGNFDEAFKVCEKTIELDPKYASAWYNKACLHSLKKDKKNALLDLSKAVNLDEKHKKEAKEDKDFKEYWDDGEFKKITS